MNYPTPTDLIEYLDGKRKAKDHFKDAAGGRCCLGHYADMCGMKYPPEQDVFDEFPPKGIRATLPLGHWILPLQSRLTRANDGHPGFDKVIKILQEEADRQKEAP